MVLDDFKLHHRTTHLIKSVEEWEKREAIKASGELQNYPLLLKYVVGYKDNRPILKAFLQENDEKTETFLKKQGEKLSNEANCEFVHVGKKMEEMWDEVRNIQKIEKDATAIPPSTILNLNKIISNEGKKIYAKYSNVVGIGVSNVLTKEKKIHKTPCIVLYCLDKNIIPFGETPLPSSIKGYPCDIREDLVMFGSCQNCQTVNPGCDIGSTFFSGSAGFLVQSVNTPTPFQGFLTAAHVVVQNCGDIYRSNEDLSSTPVANSQETIMHPSNSSNNVGKVETCIFGNYSSIGSDVAIVHMNSQNRGLEGQDYMYRPLLVAESMAPFPSENLEVVKKGNRTGVTYGNLRGVLSSARVDSMSYPGLIYSFNNCYCVHYKNREEPFFDIGDSGSAVFLIDRSDRSIEPLGIAFARGRFSFNTYVCKIKHITEKFHLMVYRDAFSSSILQNMTDEEAMDTQ